MNRVIKHLFINGWEGSASESAGNSFAVNVLFTDFSSTRAAMKTAGTLARELRASIRVLAVQAVPYAQPLDQSLVPIALTEKVLVDLVRGQPTEHIRTSAHLYLCRDKLDTLGQVLAPHSLVVIGRRWHWWPSDSTYYTRMLRMIGHEVIWADVEGEAHARHFLHSSRSAVLHR